MEGYLVKRRVPLRKMYAVGRIGDPIRDRRFFFFAFTLGGGGCQVGSAGQKSAVGKEEQQRHAHKDDARAAVQQYLRLLGLIEPGRNGSARRCHG